MSDPTATGFIGRSVLRREDHRLLRGRGSRTARCRRVSDGCSGTAVPRKPSWRSPMLSYARRTMSSRITRSIESWVPITTIGSTANASRVTRRAIQLLERQGYRVTLEPAGA
jgi:hypothetical protein